MIIPKGFKNVKNLLLKLQIKDEQYWIKRGQKRALRLFYEMAQKVPAYKDFLKKNQINPEQIKTIKDFQKVPTIDKDNYLRYYPIESLCWNGNFKNRQLTISTTSGSTGEPFYFPREQDQDLQYSIIAELYLVRNFKINEKSTLYIIGFPMGAWIGGLFTYQALKHITERNSYKLSVITPGINKLEIINAVKKLGHKFDQIIIGSYGPFLKDTIDTGIRLGLNWKEYNMKFIFSAEVFNETFRDYVIDKTNLKNIYTDTLNHYGTVDMGTMSYETPISILSRRLGLSESKLLDMMFKGISKLPTLTQYIPDLYYFEEVNGNLICSAYSGIPLVRYDLKDHGGVITYNEMINIFKENSIDLIAKAKQNKIFDTVWKIPFVYVYERSDFSVSFFAFQIYPETIRKALQKKSIDRYVTGKFTMLVEYDKRSEQYFEVNIELKPGVRSTDKLKKLIKELIHKSLIIENSEYRKTYEEYFEKVMPRITFWDYEDLRYFRPGTKQKWVLKK